MDSGNITEAQDEIIQPVNDVVSDAEATEVTPQTEATEETEFYVEVEGDQQEQPNNMSDAQTRAAWKEEKRKRKAKADALREQEILNQKLLDEMQELKSQVAKQSKGPKPDPFDYDTTEEFYTAYDAWQGKGNASVKTKVEDKPQNQGVSLSEDQEWHLHQSENKLKDSFKDYDQAKEDVKSKLTTAFNLPNDNQIMEQIAQFAHTYDADPAKVFYALNKMPSKIDSLVSNANNPAQIGRILRELDSKVKTRSKKAIDSKPEPVINGGGEVNNTNAEIQKALDKYSETGSNKDFAVYKKLLKQKR